MSITSLAFFDSSYLWLALALLTGIAAILAQARAATVFVASALVLALLSAVVALQPLLQLLVFMVVFALGTLIYLRFLWVPVPDTATLHMRSRARGLVGVKTSLLRAVRTGKSTAQIGKAIWVVRCEQPLPAGRLVEVIAWHGSELEVAAVASPANSQS